MTEPYKITAEQLDDPKWPFVWGVTQQQPDGSWVPATPLGPQGAWARLEFSLRRRPRGKRLAKLMGRIAEVGL